MAEAKTRVIPTDPHDPKYALCADAVRYKRKMDAGGHRSRKSGITGDAMTVFFYGFFYIIWTPMMGLNLISRVTRALDIALPGFLIILLALCFAVMGALSGVNKKDLRWTWNCYRWNNAWKKAWYADHPDENFEEALWQAEIRRAQKYGWKVPEAKEEERGGNYWAAVKDVKPICLYGCRLIMLLGLIFVTPNL